MASRANALRRAHGARSETGYVRTANEDRMGFRRTSYGDIYIVSDGMGGYRGGAMAAEITVQTLQEQLAGLSPNAADFPQRVREAFAAANTAVFQRRRRDDPDTCDMGATGVALVVSGSRMLVGHVGDSRAYLWRRGQGLRRLTRDHTRVQKMFEAGLVTAEQAATHPDASVLDRAIGHQPTIDADVSEWIGLRPGDLVLLCSDGLCGYVGDSEIDAILKKRGDAQTLVDKLVQCALDKGGEDNVTVQLVRLDSQRSFSVAGLFAHPAVLIPACMALSAGVAVLLSQPFDGNVQQIAQLQKQLAESDRQIAALNRSIEEFRGSTSTSLADLKTTVSQLRQPPPAAPSTAAPTLAQAKKTVTAKKETAVAASRKGPQQAAGNAKPAAQPAAAAASAAVPQPTANAASASSPEAAKAATAAASVPANAP